MICIGFLSLENPDWDTKVTDYWNKHINTLQNYNLILKLHNIIFTMTVIKSKLIWGTQNHEIVSQLQEKRWPTETRPKITQVLELADEDFKAAITVTMLNKVKENMLVVNKKTKSQQRNY